MTDASWVFAALGAWESCVTWSARGCTPNWRLVSERLAAAWPWQAAVEDETGEPLALLQITHEHLVHRYGQISLLLNPTAAGLTPDRLTELLTSAMTRLGLRKLCFFSVDGMTPEVGADRGDNSAPQAMGVAMVGRRVRLEPLRSRHVGVLHEMACSPEWPFDGANLPREQFIPYVSAAWVRPFAVIRTDTAQLIGVVLSTDEDLRSGTSSVAFALKPEVWGAVWPIEAVVLYLRYLFEGCNFRKIYLEMTQSAHDRWGGRLDRWATLEARSPEHALVGDHYEDVLRFGLHRDQWDRPALVGRITGS